MKVMVAHSHRSNSARIETCPDDLLLRRFCKWLKSTGSKVLFVPAAAAGHLLRLQQVQVQLQMQACHPAEKAKVKTQALFNTGRAFLRIVQFIAS